MNEQQIIEYLRSKSTSSKALGVAKSRTVEDFFIEHNITTRCPNCLSPKKTVQTIAVSPDISARIVAKDTQSSQILSLKAVPIPWMKLSMPSMRF